MGDMLNLPGKRDWKGEIVSIKIARDLFAPLLVKDNREMYVALASACRSWAGDELAEEVIMQFFAQECAYDCKEQRCLLSEMNLLPFRFCNLWFNGLLLEPTSHLIFHFAIFRLGFVTLLHTMQLAGKSSVRETKMFLMPSGQWEIV